MMTRSYYKRLMDAGVKIYEFESGFVHAKVYLSDDHVGIVGTINMDYRSLVHHFENGVWIYRHDVLRAVKSDMEFTMDKSIKMRPELIKNTLLKRFIRAVVYVISPLL
jgi:cardiolipin synthase